MSTSGNDALDDLAQQLAERGMLLRGSEHTWRPHGAASETQPRWVLAENGAPRFFVKLAAAEEDAPALKKEFQSLLLVRTHHRQTSLLNNLPNPVYLGHTRGGWAEVQTFVPGEPLAGALYPGGFGLMRRVRAAAFLKVLPQVLRQLHTPLQATAPPPTFTPPPGLSQNAPHLFENALARLQTAPPATGGTHGDFSPGNILHTRNQAFIVGWRNYSAEGIQVFDLFDLFTQAALGNDRHFAANLPPHKQERVGPDRVAFWLLKPGSFAKLFALGLKTYAESSGHTPETLAPLYGLFLAQRFWCSAEAFGLEHPRTTQWRLLMEHLAHARRTPLAAIT